MRGLIYWNDNLGKHTKRSDNFVKKSGRPTTSFKLSFPLGISTTVALPALSTAWASALSLGSRVTSRIPTLWYTNPTKALQPLRPSFRPLSPPITFLFAALAASDRLFRLPSQLESFFRPLPPPLPTPSVPITTLLLLLLPNIFFLSSHLFHYLTALTSQRGTKATP